MRTRDTLKLLLLSLLLFAGCGGGADTEVGEEAADSGAFRPLGSLEQQVRTPDRARLMLAIADMRTHLNQILAAGGDEMVPMVPTHRQKVEALLEQIGDQTPAADSVRRDLGRMQGMTAAELEALMEEHAGRVRRLLERHEAGGGGR